MKETLVFIFVIFLFSALSEVPIKKHYKREVILFG